MTETKFYKRTWFIVLMLLFVPPVGIFLMWKFTRWNQVLKVILSVVFGILFIFALMIGSSEDKSKIEEAEATQQEEALTEQESEPADMKAELKEKYGISSRGVAVPNDVTGSWTELFISSAEANDPTLWAYDYVKEYWEEGVSVMFVINYANHTTTAINVTEDGADGMLIITQHDSVKDEHKDAKKLGEGPVLAEWIMYHDDNGELVTERTDE